MKRFLTLLKDINNNNNNPICNAPECQKTSVALIILYWPTAGQTLNPSAIWNILHSYKVAAESHFSLVE